MFYTILEINCCQIHTFFLRWLKIWDKAPFNSCVAVLYLRLGEIGHCDRFSPNMLLWRNYCTEVNNECCFDRRARGRKQEGTAVNEGWRESGRGICQSGSTRPHAQCLQPTANKKHHLPKSATGFHLVRFSETGALCSANTSPARLIDSSPSLCKYWLFRSGT